jgi:putative ABC transport system permease protein
MFRLTVNSARSHVLRFLLTAVSVTLGVALVAGTFVLTDSINTTFDKIFDQATVGLDAQVRGHEGGESVQGGPAVRDQLPITLAQQLRQVDGVTRAVPDYQGTAILVGKDGTAVRNGGAPTFGFAFFPDDPVISLVKGSPPDGPDQVAVESSTLTRSRLAVGDHTSALIGGQPRPVTITGEVKFDAPLAGATIVLVDEATARQAFAPDGTVPSFSLTAAPGVSQQELVHRVSAVLPANAEVVTGAKVAEENRKDIEQALGFIRIFLFVFAAVSLFVGAFIIFNTFSMLVAQRTRELALLRAVGASRGQVIRVVLGEAVLVGLVGSILGLGLGLALAAGLQAFFKTLGLEISGGLPVLPHTVIWSALVGIGVTVLSAVFPAIRASRIPPVAAMRDDIALPARRMRVRGLVGGTMLVAGIAMLAGAVVQDKVAWAVAGAGAGLIVLGAVVAAPLFTRPVIRVVAWPFVRIGGAVGRLARENALRNPRRTASTAAALMMGLALIAAISVTAQSAKASVADLVDRQLTADFVLNGGGQAQFPPTVADAVQKVPGVASVATIGGVPVKVAGDTSFAIAADARGIEDNVRVDVTSGSLQSLDDGSILINSSLARDRGWAVGDTVKATVGTLRDTPLTVGGVFKDNQVLSGSMVLPRALYTKAVPVALQGDFLVYVKAEPGADLTAVRKALVAVVKPFLVVSVQDGKEFTDAQAAQVNQLLALIYVLLALSVVIAVLGIVNTLALSIFERTREIGLLRAVGLSRRQLSSTITIESVATAVFGALLGAVLGLGLGIALQHGLVSQGLEVLAIPWAQLVVVVVFAAVAGVVAAILPAIRAVRLDILRAVTTE